MSSWDNEYWDVVKELDKTQRKLRKADHDRQRYAQRIRFLQARHEILSREYNALRVERDILQSALTACERSLLQNSLQEARQAIPRVFTPISRSKNDEPAIVATWLYEPAIVDTWL